MQSERDRQEREKRRLEGGELLMRGMSQAAVARKLGVSRQTTTRWASAIATGGIGALSSRGKTGPKPSLSDEDCDELAGLLKEGPCAHGFVTELWTARRVATVIQKRFGVALSEAQAWRVLRFRLGWTVQRPERRARERNAELIAHWRRYIWPRIRREAVEQGRTIVFVDESGLSQRPTRSRTWSPRGQTPVLEFNFNWSSLSAMAGVSFYRFYFRLFEGSIKGPQVVEFLRHLQRQIHRPLLVVWDRLAAHRSGLVRKHIESTEGRLDVTWLPAYAPELNPVEFLWAHWKRHEVANLCARSLQELSYHARRALLRMRRRPNIVRAFWVQADLPL